ncbi:MULTISPECIES: LLM class F420-dependent oxidoreductase [Mycolicibacterium]|jgi:probable F420-dependent oxidoreductase|uniref:LLM class F420-dependent oxidoreductase n=1 Tax=Mycolicibacterium TaxID=1866885 RepID=UPI0018F7C649|nr:MULTISPECIES: LLM class F420-dependent oxidoreductase [Mycolicibacterium]MDW5610779.1 LLM class F420-dependent oxidoreductase [Mycolicibacterium sp. D5.8-2]QZY48091.1 LLM class F420-dependent oxidoreductase [Mycolicibacterium austroafricanum]UJL26605.1 LLM class F420-dependent oxidoreductase [Mycolicibacterium vanbaalenii]WND58709.1 LLM class F420-dependent oxidoreductase [Mycolicibacterium vanbaalenii]
MGAGGGLKVDAAVVSQLSQVPAAARTLERRGYDGCWTAEINHDPFLPLALAAEHTHTIELGTSIAVAFARNPMTVAQIGWDLQDYSQGRFILGLGSQIKPHIEKRFSMPWSKPVGRMQEFVLALRAIWASWSDGSRLDFDGEFYTHKLMTPMFVPPPHPHGDPRVFVAAVGDRMTEMCGEVADGLLAHAFSTQRYVREITIPTLTRGIERAGRTRADIEVASPLFIVTGLDEQQMAAAAVATRKQIAFYASTPAYRSVLELHGWGDLQTELHRLSREGDWDTMGSLIDDGMLAEFAVVALVDDVVDKIRARCDGVIDRVLVGFPPSIDEATVVDLVTDLRTGA